MADDFVSGGTETVITPRSTGSTSPAFNSASQAAGYESLTTGSDSSGQILSNLTLRQKQSQRHRRQGEKKARDSRPEERDALRRLWEEAKEKASLMLSGAKENDPIELGAAALELDAILDQMWALRGARELDWAGVLNFLQGVLKEENYEAFTVARCTAVAQVIQDHLGPGSVDKDDVRAARRLLRDGGFDPLRPISSDPPR